MTRTARTKALDIIDSCIQRARRLAIKEIIASRRYTHRGRGKTGYAKDSYLDESVFDMPDSALREFIGVDYEELDKLVEVFGGSRFYRKKGRPAPAKVEIGWR
ncbi:hypothetical protein IAT38_008397 [Cryptococcus sp. DSM 104549]